jgi:hypothetical protein
LEPQFREVLVKFGLLSHAADFEKRGYKTIAQVSKMTEKDLNFLKPLQRRKFQAAIAEAVDHGNLSPTGSERGSFDQSHILAFFGERPAHSSSSQASSFDHIDEGGADNMYADIGDLICRILKSRPKDEDCIKSVDKLIIAKDSMMKLRSLIFATLGYCYHNGHGVTKDDMLSEQMWKKVIISELSELANTDTEEEENEFIGASFDSYMSHTKTKKDDCVMSAQFLLGYMDDEGIGFEKDGTSHKRNRSSASKLYTKAAKVGQLACAQHALAVCLFYGDGVTEDKQESVMWDKLAADQG